ncbi:hypothetical protein DYST_00366 [Dyella terrae]|nr:hypothetical protein DYST_00366 [Dyella terrae]
MVGQLLPFWVSMCADAAQHDLRLDLSRDDSIVGRMAVQFLQQGGKPIQPGTPVHRLTTLEDFAEDFDRLAKFINKCEVHFHRGNHRSRQSRPVTALNGSARYVDAPCGDVVVLYWERIKDRASEA